MSYIKDDTFVMQPSLQGNLLHELRSDLAMKAMKRKKLAMKSRAPAMKAMKRKKLAMRSRAPTMKAMEPSSV